jgi:8-oxo-dGTP pyrophosphatase MutT (NUDIX family)
VDIDRSIMRELAEETGLVASDVVPQPGWQVVFDLARIALIKVLDLRWPAETVRAKVLAHLAKERDPELADIRILRSAADLDPMMPPVMPAFLREAWRTDVR